MSYEVYIVSIFERNSQLQQNLTAQAKTILMDTSSALPTNVISIQYQLIQMSLKLKPYFFLYFLPYQSNYNYFFLQNFSCNWISFFCKAIDMVIFILSGIR